MSSVAVYLRSENPAVNPARHSASRSLALLVLAALPVAPARWVDASCSALQLLTTETWKEVKQRVRGNARSKEIYRLLPPGPSGPLMLSYPPRGQESDARERQARVWMTATKF